MIDGMIVKMRGHDICGHIIRRMLYRGKGIDILSQRQYNNAARVLSRAAPDAGAAHNDPVDLTVPFPCTPLFIIPLHISICRLVRQRADGACPIGLACPEDYLRVLMGFALILSGEIQIDIRLLISLKAQECLKGNVETVLFQRFPAYRTQFIRHIAARPARILFHLVRSKIIVITVRTVVMRA